MDLHFWPTLITIPSLLVLLGLGTWQVERLYEKRAVIAAREASMTAAPVPLPTAGDALDGLDYRRVTATGEFRHDKEMFLAARTRQGAVGYQIVTLLALTTGGHVLVNRGWVPEDRKSPGKRLAGQIAGIVTVDGLIRVPRPKNWGERQFVPDDQPAKNLWFWTDLAAMAAHAGVEEGLVPVFIDAGPAENPGGYPIGGQTRLSLPNDHLQYAITWYSLAIALAVIYGLYHRR